MTTLKQEIRAAEEQKRKELARAKRQYNHRCFRFGERVLSTFPHLADSDETEALMELTCMLQCIENSFGGSR